MLQDERCHKGITCSVLSRNKVILMSYHSTHPILIIQTSLSLETMSKRWITLSCLFGLIVPLKPDFGRSTGRHKGNLFLFCIAVHVNLPYVFVRVPLFKILDPPLKQEYTLGKLFASIIFMK